MAIRVLREIILKNLWLAYRLPFLAGVMLLILTFMLFPAAGLTATEAGKPIEMMISFVGIVMMIAVFIPEQDKALKEVVACRKIGLEAIQFIRMILSVFFIVFLVAAYCVYLKANECQISLYMVWGGISSAFFLGSISFCVAGISGNSINGILAGMVYYICNYGLKKQLGVFHLFRMSMGIYSGKTWIFIAGVLLIMITFMGYEKKYFIG